MFLRNCSNKKVCVALQIPVPLYLRIEELEEAKRKLAARVQEMEETLTAAETKALGMEKVKNRMNEEVEDLLLDLEKVNIFL